MAISRVTVSLASIPGSYSSVNARNGSIYVAQLIGGTYRVIGICDITSINADDQISITVFHGGKRRAVDVDFKPGLTPGAGRPVAYATRRISPTSVSGKYAGGNITLGRLAG